MNKLQEYLNLIPEAWKNKEQVIEGIANAVKMELGILPENVQEEVIRRRVICQACPNMSKNSSLATLRKEDFCTLCSCPIKTKTASMDTTCGARSWNINHPDLPPEEVRWLPYKP